MTSIIQLSQTSQKLRDAKDERYAAAVEKYLSALAEQGFVFTSPGPGSPDRWIIHGAQSILFPEEELPPWFAINSLAPAAKIALRELTAIFRENLAPPINYDAPSKPKLFIGWDVGAWYCDGGESQDAIAIMDSDGALHPKRLANNKTKMWRGNLSSHIHACESLPNFIKGLITLCSDDELLAIFNASKSAVVAIDAVLGLPMRFAELYSDGSTQKLELKDFAEYRTNPLIFRKTERLLSGKGFKPLSVVNDRIGSQSSKVVYALRKFGMKPGPDGVWRSEEFHGIAAIETYPAACPEGQRTSSPEWNQDINDAVTCANVARIFSQEPARMLAPSEGDLESEILEKEGWIWVPNA